MVETKPSPLTKVHLARPPPLSRAHGFSHVQREVIREYSAPGGRDVLQGVAGNVLSTQQLCGVYAGGYDVAVNTVTSDQTV